MYIMIMICDSDINTLGAFTAKTNKKEEGHFKKIC